MKGNNQRIGLAALAAVLIMMISSVESWSQIVSHDVVVVDGSLPAVDVLVAEIKHGSQIVYLKKTNDPIRSITKILKHCAPVRTLHIFLEGRPGELVYNNISITIDSLSKKEDYLMQWRQFFDDDADIFLYGCEVGKGLRGLEFVKTLAMLTGLDVAASDNLTGDYRRGGDWFMEVKSGIIQNEIALDQRKSIEYPALLRKEPVQARRKSKESI